MSIERFKYYVDINIGDIMGYIDWGFGSIWRNKDWTKAKAKFLKSGKMGLVEGVCGVCGTKDYIFPSGELHLCHKCATNIIENPDVKKSAQRMLWLHGEVCYICGAKVISGWLVHTYICNKCTKKIGYMAKQRKERFKMYYGARRVA